jgi:hypothetical protein
MRTSLVTFQHVLPLVLWNNAFMVMVDDDDGVLSLEGHSLAFVEVYFGMLRIFLEWYGLSTLLLSFIIQDKVVLAKAR